MSARLGCRQEKGVVMASLHPRAGRSGIPDHQPRRREAHLRGCHEGAGAAWLPAGDADRGRPAEIRRLGPGLLRRAVVWSGFELSSTQRQKIALAFERQNLTQSNAIEFQTNPELIFGIEARFGDHEVGWNVDDYLQNLDRTFSQLFANNISH